jgi:anti-sigma regulatory factor (Ser/Thr protein kinase)
MIDRSFRRSVAALDEIFEFTRRFCADEGVPDDTRREIDFCVEEIFTNLVKYNRGNPNRIRIELERRESQVRACLTDFDVDPFDVTQAPAVDIDLPIDRRRPGGLGLHLVHQLADGFEYDYTNRQSRITVTKSLG